MPPICTALERSPGLCALTSVFKQVDIAMSKNSAPVAPLYSFSPTWLPMGLAETPGIITDRIGRSEMTSRYFMVDKSNVG
ncbi:hypothetical protein I302_103793 [Kwoniella bestiolae CBS 10118]|uniref:Uncharacterized protein n=1 Tax=Kwoniella bestiolae CBS 10118 TaxID=1296100 RepID=A0AAJ8K625_9TREE